ncbi:MAG: hypothetical protein ACK5LT_02560 [Lachnospirales bacterium]
MSDNKSFKERTKNMDNKEKAKYIWHYYQAYFFGGIIFLLIIGSLLNTIVFNPPPKPFSTIVILDKYYSDESLINFKNDFNAEFISEDVNEELSIIPLYPSQNELAATQKFTVMLAAGEIDIQIMDEKNLINGKSQGIFYNLDELGIDTSNNEVEMSSYTADGEVEPYPCAVKIDEDTYAAISMSSRKLDNAVVTFNYFLKNYSKLGGK